MYHINSFTPNEVAYNEAAEEAFQNYRRAINSLNESFLTEWEWGASVAEVKAVYADKIAELRDFHNIDPQTNRQRPGTNFHKFCGNGRNTTEAYK